MITEITAWGGKVSIDYEGKRVNAAGANSLYDLVNVDLRTDAVADPTKVSTIPFMFQPCDDLCRYGTITAPAFVFIRLVQEVLQEQLKILMPDAAVPQTGKWDCKTSAYMVVAHQMIVKTGVGDVAGWPLDSFDLKEILALSSRLFQMLNQAWEATKNEYGGDFEGFAVVLPDDAKGIKFNRAEVPAECAVIAAAEKKTSWGLITAVGIAVAGVLGATYAISQRGKSARKSGSSATGK